MPKDLVIYHSHCADGFMSAFIIWKYASLQNSALKDAEYFSAKYGDAPPTDLNDRRIFIVDFSYPREILLEMHARSRSLVVLDHHKTAQAALEGLGFCKFNMEKCGAQLTAEYFNLIGDPQFKAQNLLGYIQDRDLWQWQLPKSRQVSAAIASFPFRFDAWEELIDISIFDLIKDGEAIERYQQRLIDSVTSKPQIVTFEGHEVPIVNTGNLISEVGERLAQSYPFAMMWFQTEGRRIYSLRSNVHHGEDVSEIAKKYGGGGHKNAAGFWIPADKFKLVKDDAI